jgi:hypothetical protein
MSGDEPVDELDDATFERVADDTRRLSGSDGDEGRPGYREEPGMGEDEGGAPAERKGVDRERAGGRREGEPIDPDGRHHEPSARLDDPRVPLVPETTADPGESEAHAASRLGAGRRQDAWGEPEDAPDHAGNEAYEQQRSPRER